MTDQPNYRKSARSAILILQRYFRLFPREICLISGAPRSGTSALIEWLGHQPGVSAFHESRILISAHRFMEEAFKFNNLGTDKSGIAILARSLVMDYYVSSRLLARRRLLIDKEPLEPIAFPSKDYEPFIINVKKMFPDSRLLFAIRDPIATIWSMSRRTWGESLSIMETRKFTLDEYIENWCTCADIILKYCSHPNVYVVQFGRLINDSDSESDRIFDFLKIRNGIRFQPNTTKEIGFSTEEREKILRTTRPQIESLNSMGISDLS